MLQQLQDKEQQIETDRHNLEIRAEVLAQLFLQRQRNDAEVTVGDLELWQRQAKALDRSSGHLLKIDKILTQAREKVTENKSVLPTVGVPVRDYGAMQRDRKEFNDLAFRLVERQKQEDSSTKDFSDFITSFWGDG